jgi:predicted CoA-substrate-specific enzyme activase
MMDGRDDVLLFAGVDVGAKSIQAVILDEENILRRVSLTTSADADEGARRALAAALAPLGKRVEDLHAVFATGAGRADAGVAGRALSESRCASAAAALYPGVGTVIDLGAEGFRVHKLDANGKLIKSLANDKCASGTGIFLEEMATALEVTVEEAAALGSSAARREPIESLCVVFAESEVVSAVHRQVPKAEILAGVQEAIADKVAALTQRIRPRPALMIMGGGGRNAFLVRMLEEKLGEVIRVPRQPETLGALGAAVLARRQFRSIKEQR